MQPGLLFLGTGGDSVVVGKQIRASGGIILRTPNCQLHIDPGPGSLVRLKEYDVNVREHTAILVSHAHLNHCNDVNALISAMTYNGLDTRGVLLANDTLVNGNEKEKPYLSNHYKNFVERIIPIAPGSKIGIEDVEIQALKTYHPDVNAVGFKFILPDYTVVYSGDTSYAQDIAAQYEKADILILNTLTPFGMESKGNLSCDDIIKILHIAKPKLAVITHFGLKLLEADPLYVAREIQKKTDIQVVAAKDGFTVSPQLTSRKS